MTQPFTRTRITWIAYILLALYAYFLNIFGPITPFLKDEFHLSFTVSSLHYSAFAVGMLVVGLAGHLVIGRAGRELALALGAAGLGAGALLLVLGRAPAVTIAAAFLMGCVGSLILAVVPAALSEEHGELRAIAISEANVLSSLVSTAAPLLVGWLARALVGWRWALVAAALLSIAIAGGLYLARDSQGRPQAGRVGEGQPRPAPARGGLPLLFWFFWACIVLAVSIEFCMVGWSADYMERELGMARAAAAQTVSLFLGGMIVGRYAISRVLRSLQPRVVVIASLLVGLCGFLLFWSTSHAAAGMAGLALAGLGTAGLYPLLLSMAIAAASSGGQARLAVPVASSGAKARLAVPVASSGAKARLAVPVASSGAKARLAVPVASSGAKARLAVPVASSGGQARLAVPVASSGAKARLAVPVASSGAKARLAVPVASSGAKARLAVPVASSGGQARLAVPEAAGNNEAQAGARATLASGAAILALPLTLGRLADLAGLKSAFAIVAALFLALLVMMLVAGRVAPSRKQEAAPACAVE